MSTINQLRNRIAGIDVKKESFIAIESTKENITELQKNQMLKGLNQEGKKIGRYRNRKYALAKNALNPLAGLGVVDLKLTGKFSTGFQTKVTQEAFSTFSTDSKNDALVEKYDPFGLNTDSKNEYVKELRPVYVKQFKEKLKL